MIFKYKNYNLAYNLGGDPDGFPTFINYGIVGDIDLSELNRLAFKKGLKLIILERPGYGTSDFMYMENYNDWSDIVFDFFDFLNITDFSVLGISAGAPYAYAIANKFPKRTKGVYIISGLPYVLDESVFDKYGHEGIFYKKVWNYSQQEMEKEMYSVYGIYNSPFFSLMLPRNIKNKFKASLANNCSGMAQSARLQMQDWGIDVYSMPMKINFWHSKRDKIVPYNAVKVMTDKMQNIQLHNIHLPITKKCHIPTKEVMNDVFETITAYQQNSEQNV